MTELFNELFLGFKDFAYAHETWFIILSYSMFFVGLFANVAYFILILISAFSSKERSEKKDDLSEWWLMNSDVALPVSIIVPAYNEEEFIVDNVHSLLSVEYPSYEVIIVNDGSTDTTLDLLKAEFDLTPQTRAYEDTLEHRPIRELYGSKKFPHLLVIDKENGGKGDAQNAAIVVSRNPLFCIVDADTTLQGEALLRVVQPFIEDTSVVAAGAALRVGNGCTIEDGRIKDIKLSENFVPLCQTLEYLRSFFIGHLAWSKMNMVLIISGAFGLFRRDIVTQTGGYVRGTFSEDLEMALNIQKMSYRNNNKYKIRFVPETVCWTDAPRRLGPLCSQRV
jgi:cellulose synthase/poly-beta-1,6-N-acetylglucosamine synthase-like glycosyltransferase